VAKHRIPDPMKRRLLVEQELPAEQAQGIAQAYLDEDRSGEAVDFLRIAGDTARLGEMRAEAVSSGDAFLFRQVVQALGETPERDEWSRLAEAARSLGRQRYADEAQRQAERGDD
jgi:hypothetical protein